MSRAQLLEAIDRFKDATVAVVGDLMLDEYVWGNAARVSPESPVLVIDVQRESAVPGGAANVAANILALGGHAQIFGVVGDDEKGLVLKQALEERGVRVDGIVTDRTRPTTRKTRVVAQNQQVLRVDREAQNDLNEESTAEMLRLCATGLSQADGLLLSDYAKGVCHSALVSPLIAQAKESGKPFVANAKPRNAKSLVGATVVTINLAEAVATSQDEGFLSEDKIETSGEELRDSLGIETLVVTRGSRGLGVWSKGRACVMVPAHPAEVYDVAGAGDTVAAVLALSLAAGIPLDQGSRLAVVAASVVVGKVGVATVSADELREALGRDA